LIIIYNSIFNILLPLFQHSGYPENPSYQDPCDYNTVGMGTIAIALNGVSLFGACSQAQYPCIDPIHPPAGWAVEDFDACMAHPQQQGIYHYHAMVYRFLFFETKFLIYISNQMK